MSDTSPTRRSATRTPRSKRGSLSRSGHSGMRTPSASPQRSMQRDYADRSPDRSPGRSPRRQSRSDMGRTGNRSVSRSPQPTRMFLSDDNFTISPSDALKTKRSRSLGSAELSLAAMDNSFNNGRRSSMQSPGTRKVLDSNVKVLTTKERLSLTNSVAELFDSLEDWGDFSDDDLDVKPKKPSSTRIMSKSHQMDIAAKAKGSTRSRRSSTGRQRSRSRSLSSKEGIVLDESPPPPTKPKSMRRRTRSSGSIPMDSAAGDTLDSNKPMRRRSRSGSFASSEDVEFVEATPRKPVSMRRRSRSRSLTSEDNNIEDCPFEVVSSQMADLQMANRNWGLNATNPQQGGQC